MIIALYAALAMLIQDVLGVLMVQAEARNHVWLTGALDSVGWLATITTTTVSVTALQGHSLALKATVIAAVTVANFGGSALGVKIGKHFIKETPCPCQMPD